MEFTQDTDINNTTYARVCEKLRNDIVSGYYEPGARLRMKQLVERYQVSQMPIREAIQQLQGEGLLILNPQKGAHIRKLDESFISNMYDIRIAIESMLVSKGIVHLTDFLHDELCSIEEQYETALAGGNLVESLRWNELFHRKINDLAQNPEAVQIINRHWKLIDGLRRHFGFSPQRTTQAAEEHRELLRALKERDEERAAAAAAKHVTQAKLDLMEQMRLRKLP